MQWLTEKYQQEVGTTHFSLKSTDCQIQQQCDELSQKAVSTCFLGVLPLGCLRGPPATLYVFSTSAPVRSSSV